jgi:HEXXH motif-containing protein
VTGEPFRLTVADFEALAAGRDANSDVLLASQLSKRLLLLFGVLNVEAAATRPQPANDSALAQNVVILLAAREANRDVVDRLLLQPQVGRWAMHSLRQVRDATVSDSEVGAGLSYYGSLASVAAAAAHLAMEITVRIAPDGTLPLPTRGLVRLSAGERWATLRTKTTGPDLTLVDGRHEIQIGAGDAEGASWWPVHRLHSAAAGQRIDLYLDDVDPYRSPPNLQATDRLDATALAAWRDRLDAGWSLLATHHPEQARAVGRGVTALTPLRATEGEDHLSATTADAFGGVSMTAPDNGTSVALALVHEYQHSKLSALLDLIPLFEPRPDRLFYAPWRPDPRPMRGLIQGSYAYLGLLLFWEAESRRLPDSPAATAMRYEFALWRQGVSLALDQLWDSGQLNQAGHRFVAGMRRRTGELLALALPAETVTSADQTAADFRISWRLRNLVPDPESIEAFFRAWNDGGACPPAASVPVRTLPGRRGSVWTGRASLTRQRLAEPESHTALEGDPPTLARTVAGATAADAALVSGEYGLAVRLYRDSILRSPADLSALAGLALVRRRALRPGSQALDQRPELVASLLRRLAQTGRHADPDDVAAWISESNSEAEFRGPLSGAKRSD